MTEIKTVNPNFIIIMCQACMNVLPTEEFGGKLLNILNHGALSLMVSIGHRTGLFDTLSKLPPSTSSEIAEASGLNERYVREWLGSMVTGGIIIAEEEATGLRFSLPETHAALLTRAAAADNIAVFTQYIAVLGSVEDEIVECFRKGGGVPYEKYRRFHAVMAEDSGQSVGSSLFTHILPLIPGLREDLEAGIELCDVGCGSGRTLNLLARNFPNSRFTGFDLSSQALGTARREAAMFGLTNVAFKQRDLTTFDVDAPADGYDVITAFDAIHDQARPDHVLAGISRALRPDGVFLMQDIAGSSNVLNNMEHPIGTLIYTISCMHCMTVSLAQGGMGLGAMWGKEKALAMLAEAGFGNVEIHKLSHDIQNLYYVAKFA